MIIKAEIDVDNKILFYFNKICQKEMLKIKIQHIIINLRTWFVVVAVETVAG